MAVPRCTDPARDSASRITVPQAVSSVRPKRTLPKISNLTCTRSVMGWHLATRQEHSCGVQEERWWWGDGGRRGLWVEGVARCKRTCVPSRNGGIATVLQRYWVIAPPLHHETALHVKPSMACGFGAGAPGRRSRGQWSHAWTGTAEAHTMRYDITIGHAARQEAGCWVLQAAMQPACLLLLAYLSRGTGVLQKKTCAWLAGFASGSWAGRHVASVLEVLGGCWVVGVGCPRHHAPTVLTPASWRHPFATGRQQPAC